MPVGYTVTMAASAEHYDCVVIGSGQAGKPLALDLAKAGWKTAIVERQHVGGTCINVGCTPTKTMVASARVAKMPMAWVARALEVDESRGFMKAVVDADTNQILGCAILGIEGGELMSMLQIAMMGRVPYPALRDAIFAHPTLAESLNNLFASLGG